MSKTKYSKQSRPLLPVCVIEAAVFGDEDAIEAVLDHFDGYITALATWKMRDEYGNTRRYVNETIRDELRGKLMRSIRKFKVA
jgi:hypothetical protein